MSNRANTVIQVQNMSQSSIQDEFISPGALLRATRVKQNLAVTDIADETNISLKNIKAMEADDFSSLPAEAYSRGFYRLYAEALSLSPGDILKKYMEEKSKYPSPSTPLTESPKALTSQVSDMAARSNNLSLTYIGLVLFLLFLFGAFFSWYFSWNPAKYISERLRGVQYSEQMKHAQESDRQPVFIEPALESAQHSPFTGKTSATISIPDTQYFLR